MGSGTLTEILGNTVTQGTVREVDCPNGVGYRGSGCPDELGVEVFGDLWERSINICSGKISGKRSNEVRPFVGGAAVRTCGGLATLRRGGMFDQDRGESNTRVNAADNTRSRANSCWMVGLLSINFLDLAII